MTDYPQLWGGIECTINRVGDRYFDQLSYSGHYDRPADIDLIAGLGCRKLRYPILWERHQPDRHTAVDWAFTASRLGMMRAAGITPIAGLLHHGCGPAWVEITDDSFVHGLAAYAGQVARRFPWLEYYTPINEPLTTARFTGLYGHWYPHGTDNQTFARILYNQCKATALAMRAVRAVNPAARLILTEDLCKVHSTPLLRYQADFENERRWLPFDLLLGRLDARHPLYEYLLNAGISVQELDWFREHPEIPHILGFNHHVTSERYLDERLDHYPPQLHGGNGRHRYADVEAIRVAHGQPSGLALLLTEAWERYGGLPMAVTEAHLACDEADQLRWFREVWAICRGLAAKGIDIRGVTAWALFGQFGWDRLLTEPCGTYETGVFRLAGGSLHPTLLAGFLSCLNRGMTLATGRQLLPGWWQKGSRILYRAQQQVPEAFTNQFS